MADNENKIVLNVPGQANVDPSEVTQESLSLKDPLSGRDTDTGSLARLDDTRTRKTVKIKPSSNTGPVPVINIGSAAAVPPAIARVSTESGRVPTESARINDVLSGRDTDTGNLAKMDDTKTRKTVKLAPLSAAGPVPVMKLGTVSTPINTESMPISPDDTRTRQTVVLKSAPELVPAPSLPTESASLSDVLTGRDTDTGNLERMDDTKTRKTIKLTPLTVGGPIPKITPLAKPSIPGTQAPAVPPANFAATVELKPVVMPVPGQTAPGIPTDTGSLRGVLGDTSTRKTVKITPPVSAAPPINFAATVELKPVVIPVPGKTEPGVSTDTGSLRGVLEDTSTRKTVKISPLPEPAVPPVVPPGLVAKENNDDTVKLQRAKIPSVPPTSETASPLPAVAQAKAVVPGSKQTIKLRPSTGASAPPEEPASSPAIKLSPAATTSKDTIKLTPSSTASSAPAASSPTLNLAGSATPPSAIGVASSAPTVNMGIKPPAPAGGGLAPSSPTINLSAPAGLSLKKPALTPSSPPPAEQKPGLSLPGRAPAIKPPEPAAEELAAVADTAEDAGGEAVEEEKKGGLQIKKRGVEEEPQGPPRVQTDLDKIAKGPVTVEGQPSMLYFALALVSVICLLLSVYITAAQYINLWEQARVKTKLPVPFLSEIVK